MMCQVVGSMCSSYTCDNGGLKMRIRFDYASNGNVCYTPCIC